ncbi:nucleoporin nup49 protein [Diplodia corticola]|uniref:Nucleoporin nup49 protein n=1 Tax=Diplodia corticola TaxID=236234 RepID=A0A1J9S5I9_9PEZI|nr:nucleoporin nup49 protein [Diplodia corticola]OJD40227.1 nucleoporin nup49 protein [Diplodia corticola]
MAAVTQKPGEQTLARDASVLAYARFHRICRDYTRESPLDSRHLPQAPIFLAQELSDPSGCPQFQFTQPVGTSERLEIDSAAAHLLNSVFALRSSPQVTDAYCPPHLTRHLKVETPLLRIDHELDSFRFRKRESLNLTDVTLPLEHTDDEKDEGLSWPLQCRNFSHEFHGKIASDRLDVQKQALLYLQSVMKRPDKPDIPDSAPVKRRLIQPITPPLLPLSPEFTHVPDPSSSSPTGQVQLLSGTTDSIAVEAEALEARISKEDRIDTDDVPGLKYYTEDPMLWDGIEDLEVETTAPSFKPRRRAAELKIETPLTPPANITPPFRSPAKNTKSVSFPDEMLQYITYPMEIPSKYEDGNAVLDSENDFDAFFEEDMAPIAKRADWRAEHEQLHEADTTKRVEVPDLDFEIPIAPWHSFGLRASLKKDGISTELEAQARLLSYCAKEELKITPKWPESNKQDGELKWWAFPRNLSKTVVAEEIQHDAALNKMIGSSPMGDVDIVDSSSLAWKHEGLRVLDQPEDEDEEILPWHFEPGDDLGSLLQKRKSEIANASAELAKRLPESLSKESVIYQPQKKQKTNENAVHESTRLENQFMLGGLFSASNSLEQFMQINSGTMNTKQPLEKRPPEEKQQDNAKVEASISDASKRAVESSQSPMPLPAPPIADEQPPKPFIISSSLLIQRRELVRTIQRLYPRAILIERDFSRPLSTSTTTSTPINHHQPPTEPDLLLSPSTGLLITTLQRIKQRALPSNQHASNNNNNTAAAPHSTTTTTFQTELAHHTTKLQHLIVLVSGASSLDDQHPATKTTTTTAVPPLQPLHPPDARDCDALAALHGFAAAAGASPRCRVSVAYVPGGVADAARWVVGVMAAYGRTEGELVGDRGGGGGGMGEGGDVVDGGEQQSSSSPSSLSSSSSSSVLKEEESLWELFLRRAGLNAFAAQVVLARLKKKEVEGVGRGSAGDGGGGPAAHGLAAFVGMGREERREVFDGVLGDGELLDAVGRRVDGLWVTPRSQR